MPVITLSVCFGHDLHRPRHSSIGIAGHVKNGRLPGVEIDMLYYADDTILLSQCNRALNELLKRTEDISECYGLKLNRGKCVAVAMNNDGKIHFKDQAPLDKAYEAM